MPKRCDCVLTFALSAVIAMLGCTSSPAKKSSEAAVSKSPAVQHSDPADLQAAMDKLQASLEKPVAPFHASFKKSDSDGFTTQCEAEISSDGIMGQQTDSSPETHIGNDVFPASTRTRQLNGTPFHSPNWYTAYGNIAMAYLNGHIHDAQPGVKFLADEQVGGYDTRHYDFDLTGVDADIKKAMQMGNSMGMRQTKDYNVKGSAWIAKDDGRMVKFAFENVYTFSDGKTSSTRFEGTVTKK